MSVLAVGGKESLNAKSRCLMRSAPGRGFVPGHRAERPRSACREAGAARRQGQWAPNRACSWAGCGSQVAPCFIKLEPDNRKPIISEGTLSPEHRLNSGSCCCPRDDMERSTAGRPEAALGVSPFPPNLAESCSPKNAVFLRWGTRPSARALGGLLRNRALPQSYLFFH